MKLGRYFGFKQHNRQVKSNKYFSGAGLFEAIRTISQPPHFLPVLDHLIHADLPHYIPETRRKHTPG
jgi:hypothetical protein